MSPPTQRRASDKLRSLTDVPPTNLYIDSQVSKEKHHARGEANEVVSRVFFSTTMIEGK